MKRVGICDSCAWSVTFDPAAGAPCSHRAVSRPVNSFASTVCPSPRRISIFIRLGLTASTRMFFSNVAPPKVAFARQIPVGEAGVVRNLNVWIPSVEPLLTADCTNCPLGL